MEENKKYAYRYLLYWGVVDARRNAWFKLPWNPLQWREACQSVQHAGAIADAMHNLALFSALDFKGFDEERFWRDLGGYMREQDSEKRLDWYRSVFEKALEEFWSK